jgi:hypothetical protein
MITPAGVSGLVLAGAVLWRPLAGVVLMAVWRWRNSAPVGLAGAIGREVFDRDCDG